jgi:hypothetical protein
MQGAGRSGNCFASGIERIVMCDRKLAPPAPWSLEAKPFDVTDTV